MGVTFLIPLALVAAAHVAPVATARVGAAAQADAAAEVTALQRAGRFAEALARATSVPDAALAARLEANVRWAAGDLDGALAVAHEGLTAAPSDLLLLDLAADLALALDLAGHAREHLTALDRALAATQPEGEAGAWWAARRERLATQLETAELRLADRDRALGRARLVGGAFLALAATTFLGLIAFPGAGAAIRRVPGRDAHEP